MQLVPISHSTSNGLTPTVVPLNVVDVNSCETVVLLAIALVLLNGIDVGSVVVLVQSSSLS
jgi:hypothetical protein